MDNPIKLNLDFTSDFRQVILKLANTYEPKFDTPEHFENIEQLLDSFTTLICEDFSNQLYPLIYEKLSSKLHQQLP